MDEADSLPPIEELRKKTYKTKREDRIRVILAMRASGQSYAAIAAHIGSTHTAIYHVIKRQRRRLREEGDPQALLDGKCKTKAVRNLERILDDKGHPANWTATRDTLYGTGMLKRHISTKNEGSNAVNMPALTVNVVNVQPIEGQHEPPKALPDITVNAVGTPREL